MCKINFILRWRFNLLDKFAKRDLLRTNFFNIQTYLLFSSFGVQFFLLKTSFSDIFFESEYVMPLWTSKRVMCEYHTLWSTWESSLQHIIPNNSCTSTFISSFLALLLSSNLYILYEVQEVAPDFYTNNRLWSVI